jgi:hypothetical protein
LEAQLPYLLLSISVAKSLTSASMIRDFPVPPSPPINWARRHPAKVLWLCTTLDLYNPRKPNPTMTPFKGFHPFQVFVIFPIHVNPWAILCGTIAVNDAVS